MLSAATSLGQLEPHFTIFMFNKLLYNPAYSGNKEVYSFIADYRDQWKEISGAPKTLSFTADKLIGPEWKYTKFAMGMSASSEHIGVENNTDLKLYGSYHLPLNHEKLIMSFGLSFGGKLYSTNYNELNPYNANDPNLTTDFHNKYLPNAGAGIFLKDANNSKFYVGFSVPNILQNYLNKNSGAKETRGYYLIGGYVIPIVNKATDDGNSDTKLALVPQTILRYIYGGEYQLPFSADFNLSAIFYNRILFGITYRTDESFDFITHIQVLHSVSIGYAHDYMSKALSPYTRGTDEIIVGYDILARKPRFLSPHFMKSF